MTPEQHQALLDHIRNLRAGIASLSLKEIHDAWTKEKDAYWAAAEPTEGTNLELTKAWENMRILLWAANKYQELL